MTKSTKHIFVICAGIIALGFLVFFIVAKTAQNGLYNILPKAVASINGQPVYLKDLDRRVIVEQSYNKNVSSESAAREAILTQLISEEKIKQLSERNGVIITQQEVDQVYAGAAEMYKKQSSSTLETFISRLGLSPEEYKQQIIKPQALYEKLARWHNSQENLNIQSYKRFAEIQQKISEGQDFDALAKLYTEDAAGTQLAGDIGFVALNTLIPEIREQLHNSEVGTIVKIVSRDGLHIVKVLSKETKENPRLYIKQIFIQPENFNDWVTMQTKNYTVKKFISG